MMRLALAVLSGALLSVAACSQAPTETAPAEKATAASTAEDEAAIRKLFADLMAAVKAEDAAAVAQAYAPEGFIYLDVSTPRAFHGRKGAEHTWKLWFSMIEPGSGTGDATELQVTVVGDYAFAMHFDHYTAKPKDPKLQHLVDFTNRATSWLKKIDGRWYILVEHNSFPVDLVNGQADFKSKE